MSHDDVQLPAAQDEPGVDRRKFIIGTAAAGAGMWAAPSILSVDRAFAQTAGTDQPGGGTADCDTSARALTVMSTGLVDVNAGPFSSCQDDTGGDPFAKAKVSADGSTLIRAEVLDTDCSQDPCRATASVAELRIDLTSLGIPLQLRADVITATAECEDGETTLSSTIANLTLRVDDDSIFADVDVSAEANTTVVDLDLDIVTLLVILNQQAGDTVNAIRITASVPDLLGETQTVDVIVASATATCT